MSYRTILIADVLQDDLAISLARVLAAANKRVRELGVNVAESIITVAQQFDDGMYWRVNYGAKDYINQRGGDIIVDVDAHDANVRRVLYGQ